MFSETGGVCAVGIGNLFEWILFKMEVTENINKHTVISQWVNQYSDALYASCYFKISDEAAAQDLVQETFISAFQHFEKFQKASSPKTWLYAMLKNKIIDYYRQKAKGITAHKIEFSEDETTQWFDEDRRWKKEYRPEPWDTDENLLDSPEFESTFAYCIGKLPASWSVCVQMKYLSEKDTLIICQELNITPSNLWQVLHRAKLHLRNCLEKNWFKA